MCVGGVCVCGCVHESVVAWAGTVYEACTDAWEVFAYTCVCVHNMAGDPFRICNAVTIITGQ